MTKGAFIANFILMPHVSDICVGMQPAFIILIHNIEVMAVAEPHQLQHRIQTDSPWQLDAAAHRSSQHHGLLFKGVERQRREINQPCEAEAGLVDAEHTFVQRRDIFATVLLGDLDEAVLLKDTHKLM